jgi:hypothetical protein
VPERDLALIAQASPLEYAALKRGDFTIEALREQHRQQRRRRTPQAIRKFLAEADAARVLAEIDAMTRPQPVAAE